MSVEALVMIWSRERRCFGEYVTTDFLRTSVREHILLFHNFYYHGIPSNVDAKFLFRGYLHHIMTKSDRTNSMRWRLGLLKEQTKVMLSMIIY